MLRVTTFRWLVRLKPSTIVSTLTRSFRRKARLILAFTVKKGLPFPAIRSMNAPLTIGRAALLWIVVTPEVMLNGGAE